MSAQRWAARRAHRRAGITAHPAAALQSKPSSPDATGQLRGALQCIHPYALADLPAATLVSGRDAVSEGPPIATGEWSLVPENTGFALARAG